MENIVTGKSHKMLFLNTLAFTICFAAWMLNGVLVTFLVDNGVFNWTPSQSGWLFGVPVLTGAFFRLPMGILTDKYGGKWIFAFLFFVCAVPIFFLSYANSYISFFILSFCFGIIGSGFAVAIAYTSVWYPKNKQGIALGIVGAGNAGAAITTLFAPVLLLKFTNNSIDIDSWRLLPQVYAYALIAMGVIFLILAENKIPDKKSTTVSEMLAPIKNIRVWRFGLYYFLVFGCFVAFAQWLVPYFINVYEISLVTAGVFASLFSFPSGVIRILGGWLSDKVGARKVMYWTLGSSLCISFMLIIPKMEVMSPGKGLMSNINGTVSFVSDSLIVVNETDFIVNPISYNFKKEDSKLLILPSKDAWQSPIVNVGDKVVKKQLLAKGTTRIYFQANMWVFAALTILIGIVWGIGKAAVYKHIPEYFPTQVGVVGGIVGVIGGLGGFVCPIIFGYLLEFTGLWTSSWMFIVFVSAISLWWMNNIVNKILNKGAPHLSHQFENKNGN